MTPNITIIVPVYNEEKTVMALFERLQKVLAETPITSQVIVVDDGSIDRTKELIQNFQSQLTPPNNWLFFAHTDNQGKGAAIHTAIVHATGEYTIIQDADLEYNPADILQLYNYAQGKNLPVLYGSRNISDNKKDAFHFYWGGRLVTSVANVLFHQRLTDEATCYKLIKTNLLQSFDLREKDFAFCPEVTAKIAATGELIQEIPVCYTPRTQANGKKINWRDGLRAIAVLFKLKFTSNPINFRPWLLGLFVFSLYLTTWQKNFGGYEGETARAAINLFHGIYDIKRAGISAAILYLPFVAVFEFLGKTNISLLSIVPIFYSSLTAIGLYYCTWHLTNNKNKSLLLALLISTGSTMWPYANIGMEYQTMFLLTCLLWTLLRWQKANKSLIPAAIIFALLCTAKSYGLIFGLPLVIFIALVMKSQAQTKEIAKKLVLVLIPGAMTLGAATLLQWIWQNNISDYTVAHEFQVWTWWEGFYGIFFSAGKSIFLFSPLLILTLFTWKKFWANHRETAIFILLSFGLLLLITAPFSYWSDETWNVRKLVPIMGLLHLPLIYIFDRKPNWRQISTWATAVLIIGAVYVQILGATYYYGKQMNILRAANLDSLQNIRFTPELSGVAINHQLLRGYLTGKAQELNYSEPTWFRWMNGDKDILLGNGRISLEPYQTPDIVWFRENYTRNLQPIFWGLIIWDWLLLTLILRRYRGIE